MFEATVFDSEGDKCATFNVPADSFEDAELRAHETANTMEIDFWALEVKRVPDPEPAAEPELDYVKAEDLKPGDSFTTQSEWDDAQQFGAQPGVFTVENVEVRRHTTRLFVTYREPGVFAQAAEVYENTLQLVKL